MQINRLLEIVYVLLRHQIVTAKSLAERFDVSQRTIYRDIDALSLAGIPVYTEKGKNGGIGLLPGFVLNKSILSESEQQDILSALQGLSTIKAGETDHVLEKISAVFNKNATSWLEVDFSNWGNTNSCFYDFKKAVLERRVVTFDYYSTFGDKTHRRAEPVQLWFKSRAWYVKCFCLIRQDLRLFKLARVKNLLLTDTHFSERNLLNVVPNVSPPEHDAQVIDLKFRVAPEMTYRIFDDFDESMVEKQPDGSHIVSVIWPEDDWLYGYLLSYAEYAEVLEPVYLRDILKDKAQKMMKKYSV